MKFVKSYRNLDDKGFTNIQGKEYIPVDFEKLKMVASFWVGQIIEWEYHLRQTKQMIWGGVSKPIEKDAEFEEKAFAKVERRLGFVLSTDWRKFPNKLNEEQSILG